MRSQVTIGIASNVKIPKNILNILLDADTKKITSDKKIKHYIFYECDWSETEGDTGKLYKFLKKYIHETAKAAIGIIPNDDPFQYKIYGVLNKLKIYFTVVADTDSEEIED